MSVMSTILVTDIVTANPDTVNAVPGNPDHLALAFPITYAVRGVWAVADGNRDALRVDEAGQQQ